MYKSPIKLSRIVSRCVLLVIIFLISLLVGNAYTEGDQYFYGLTYDAISTMELVEAFVFYTWRLESIEIIHFLFIWTLSSYFPKVLLFSMLNTVFAALIIRLFDILKVNFFMTCVFLLSNYYLYVLFFAAERLKFGFFLLVLGLCIQSSKALKSSTFLLSLAAHFQMILVYAPKAFEWVVSSFIRFLKIKRLNLEILVLLVPLAFLPLVGDKLLAKLEAYDYATVASDFIRISGFLILSVWYAAKEKCIQSAVVMFIPLFVAVYFVSGDRVNMIAYFYFLYFALRYKNGLNAGMLATSIYFLGKTVLFLVNVDEIGHGGYG